RARSRSGTGRGRRRGPAWRPRWRRRRRESRPVPVPGPRRAPAAPACRRPRRPCWPAASRVLRAVLPRERPYAEGVTGTRTPVGIPIPVTPARHHEHMFVIAILAAGLLGAAGGAAVAWLAAGGRHAGLAATADH